MSGWRWLCYGVWAGILEKLRGSLSPVRLPGLGVSGVVNFFHFSSVHLSFNLYLSPIFSIEYLGLLGKERDSGFLRQALLMKIFRLLRWSGSVLTPRKRPCYIHLHSHYPKFTFRLQSSAATLPRQQDPDDISSSSSTSQEASDETPEIDLSALPSPPPSVAVSSAKLSALHARLNLSSRLPLETLSRCLIDPSADSHPSFNNASLSLLGTDLCGYYASEALLCRYPRLPTEVLFAAMWAYCGPKTLAALRREWGVEVAAAPGGEVDSGYLQCTRLEAGNSDADGTGTYLKDSDQGKVNLPKGWSRGVSSRTMLADAVGEPVRGPYKEGDPSEDPQLRAGRAVTVERASTNFVRALVGAVYLHCGRKSAKRFFNLHIQSRQLNISQLFDFQQPTRDLSKLCAREGFDSPIARILSETGRTSRHPVFVVGVFAGKEKLGEGVGSSLDEARIRAAVAALKGWYLYSPLEVRVPSDAEGLEAKPWEPVMIDGGEVVV